MIIDQSGGAPTSSQGAPTGRSASFSPASPRTTCTITLTPTSQLGLSPSTLTFTPSNWNVARTVMVMAASIPRFRVFRARHRAAAALDPNYNGIAMPSVPVSIPLALIDSHADVDTYLNSDVGGERYGWQLQRLTLSGDGDDLGRRPCFRSLVGGGEPDAGLLRWHDHHRHAASRPSLHCRYIYRAGDFCR